MLSINNFYSSTNYGPQLKYFRAFFGIFNDIETASIKNKINSCVEVFDALTIR